MIRAYYVIVTLVATIGVAIPSLVSLPLLFVWNASASVPIGFYLINRPRDVRVGDLVAVMPPKPLADFMVERGYIDRGVPLLKHVAALPGQKVCRTGNAITVEDMQFGIALDRDRRGRPLPIWQGCLKVADGDIFLMNVPVADSLDGRYFGPISASTVIGQATPLYTDEDGDGRFVWRADTH